MKTKKILFRFWYALTYRFRIPRILVRQASLSGDGSFIDIRYWLSRPDKIDHKNSPYLIKDKTLEHINLLHLAKFGAIQTKIGKGSCTGIMLFYNKGTSIKSGDNITLWWDTLKTDSVVVQ